MSAVIKNILITICIAGAAVPWAGCSSTATLGGIMSSETEAEKVVRAEFDLAKTDGNLVVVVSQPAWVKTPMDLRIKLTDAINMALEEKAKIKKERLTPYMDVLQCRMGLADEKRDDPFAIASKLNMQYVLAVQITDFELSTFAEEDLFNGMMITKSCLFDVNSSKMWPQDANNECRQITVGFEDEKATAELAVDRLAAATAHCITRYLYNCKKEKFRIAEEQKELDYYTW